METARDRFKDMAYGTAWGAVFAFAIFGVMAFLGSPLACHVR